MTVKNQQTVLLGAILQLDMMTKDTILKLVFSFNNECGKFQRPVDWPNQQALSHCKYTNITAYFNGLFNPVISQFYGC